MFNTLKKALKIKEIRNGLIYTFVMLIIVRIGCQLPLPDTNPDVISEVTSGFANGAFGFFDALTGGSFSEMSVFALNITPYITATIIIQLLTIAIPKLEEMQKDGEDGRKKIQKITRFMTVGLAVLEAAAYAIGYGSRGVFNQTSGTGYVIDIVVAIIAMTAGSALVMWMGEQITEKGVGNGISIILLINIVARMPQDIISLFEKFVKGASSVGGAGLAAIIIIATILFVIAFVVVLQDATRKIAVQYSKKVQGRKTFGGQSSFIPLKVNTAGVIPVIFAQSLLQFPVVIASFFGHGNDEWTKYLSQSNWCNPDAMIYSIGFAAYIILVVFFAYFYTSITFNPIEVANNMKKQGGFIPGIRPGKSTSDYLQSILNYVIFIGATGLLIVCVVPIIISGVFGASISFGGTSLIIVVGVILETMKNIESRMVVRSYKGFLTD